ncbi:MAG: hypothetical protein ABR926_20645 [Streptosporangiaceae bacterium]|jgi:hypothetical protein
MEQAVRDGANPGDGRVLRGQRPGRDDCEGWDGAGRMDTCSVVTSSVSAM